MSVSILDMNLYFLIAVIGISVLALAEENEQQFKDELIDFDPSWKNPVSAYRGNGYSRYHRYTLGKCKWTR